MKSMRRMATAAVVSALLAIGGAGAAHAATTYPAGGVWTHGANPIVYSNYYHPSRWHGSTAVGRYTYRSALVAPGRWSVASAPRKAHGNRAYYRFS